MKSATITLYVSRGLKSRKRYVGITHDLARRREGHRRDIGKGAQLIGEFELVFIEGYPTYLIARERERFLQSGQACQWLDSTLGK